MNEFCRTCDDRGREGCALPSRLEAFSAHLASARSKSFLPFIFSHQFGIGANNGDQGAGYLEQQQTGVAVCITEHQAALRAQSL